MADQPLTVVNIRPKVAVFSVLAHLEYKAWYALAEYVDNSIQSFQENIDQIREIEGPEAKLRVTIEVDTSSGGMSIRDNAGGIALKDFPRAFRPAEIPLNRGGLSEFGMGMKSASCWFAPVWRVRTSAIGEPLERAVSFNIDQIVTDQLEELEVHEKSASAESHYTVIELSNVRSLPVRRTSGKIKLHLADIYRDFLRKDELELLFAGQELSYDEPEILSAPKYDSNNHPSDSQDIEWRKEINFDFGNGLRVSGFGALRKTMSNNLAGFSLFRRGRVIEGSGDNKYQPEQICGSSGSPTAKRLFGELHLEGFNVSHTKDGFRWDEEDEDAFLGLLKEHLDEEPLPLLQQARRYRDKARDVIPTRIAERAIESTGSVIQTYLPEIIPEIVAETPSDDPPPLELNPTQGGTKRVIRFPVDDVVWSINLELSTDESIHDWLEISESIDPENRTLGVRIGLESEFVKNMVDLSDQDQVDLITRLGAGLALSECLATMGGAKFSSQVRANLNQLLSTTLSRNT